MTCSRTHKWSVDGTAGTGTWGSELGRIAWWLGVDLIGVVQTEPLLGRWRGSSNLPRVWILYLKEVYNTVLICWAPTDFLPHSSSTGYPMPSSLKCTSVVPQGAGGWERKMPSRKPTLRTDQAGQVQVFTHSILQISTGDFLPRGIASNARDTVKSTGRHL